MKLLLVGDVHAKLADLWDCYSLIQYVHKIAQAHKPDAIVFLGDQYDTHGVVSVEVQRFWLETFRLLRDFKVIALQGNHDISQHSGASSMQVHEDITVVGLVPYVWGDTVFLGYHASQEGFVKAANQHTAKTLICHQTFDGAKYDNGFYAKDGIDPNLVQANTIISGHIHTPAHFGKVTYVGAPRWQTVSDANIDRSIDLYDTETNTYEFFYTGGVCRRISVLEDNETNPVDAANLPPGKVIVNVHGSKDYIQTRKEVLGKAGAQIRSFVTQEARRTVSEAEGITKAWARWLEGYRPQYGVEKGDLVTKLMEDGCGIQT